MNEISGTESFSEQLRNWLKSVLLFSDPERPRVILPGLGPMVLGIIVLVIAAKGAAFVSGIVPILPRQPAAPYEWVTNELAWTAIATAATAACAVAGLAVYVILEHLPTTMTFDSVAGELIIRHPLRKRERRPLSDVETLKVVFDQNESMATNYYTVAVYRKELVCPATRLTMMVSNPGDAGLDEKKRIAILDVLANAAPPAASVQVSEWLDGSEWFSFGARYYRLYDSFARLFWRIVLSNLLVVGALLYFHQRFHPVIDAMLLEAFEHSFQPVLVWGGFAALVAAVVAVEIAFVKVGLRIDSQSRTVSFYRMLGLWRTDCNFSERLGFYLTRKNNIHGLYVITDKCPPVCLSPSRSPQRLRRALIGAGIALGVDPWPLFHPHPVEYDAADARPGFFARLAPYLGRAEDGFEQWTSAFESWIDKKTTRR